jgi:hypothetical protein
MSKAPDGVLREIAQRLCRIGCNDCVMDDRPYRGDCTRDNCQVMRGVCDIVDGIKSPRAPDRESAP